MRRLRRLWSRVTEPRLLSVVYFAIYTVVLLTGVATLLAPPMSIEGALGSILTVIWSVLLIMGGTGGMLTVLPGWWWAERLSILLVWAGIGIYLTVVISLHITGSGSRLTQLGMIVLATSTFVVRWVLIRKYSFAPQSRG